MSELVHQSERFRRAAEIEEQVTITAGAPLLDLRSLAAPPISGELIALAKLVELRRRSMGLTVEDLSRQVSISPLEILRLEAGYLVPRVRDQLPALARVLRLREVALLELAGVKPDSTGRVLPAAQAFVSRAASPDALTPSESEALEEFVRLLESA